MCKLRLANSISVTKFCGHLVEQTRFASRLKVICEARDKDCGFLAREGTPNFAEVFKHEFRLSSCLLDTYLEAILQEWAKQPLPSDTLKARSERETELARKKSAIRALKEIVQRGPSQLF